MDKKIILGIAILTVFILGLIVLAVTLFLDFNKNVSLDSKDASKTSSIQNIQIKDYYNYDFSYPKKYQTEEYKIEEDKTKYGYSDEYRCPNIKNYIYYDSDSKKYDYRDYSKSSCNPENYECFRYERLEQKRLEPCPTPRPVCPLCYPSLEQIKRIGYSESLVQTKTVC